MIADEQTALDSALRSTEPGAAPIANEEAEAGRRRCRYRPWAELLMSRHDLASWGQVGAVHVLEAQPASAFGDVARAMVAGGRAEPGFEGAVRCVVPIAFRMPDGAASGGQ